MKVLSTTAIIIALGGMAGACGGKPVGSKVPKVKAAHAAGAAALVAGALTLADPDSSGRRPESDQQKSLRGKKSSGETVPTGVLDRANTEQTLPLCSELAAQNPSSDSAAGSGDAKKKPAKLELIPAPVSNEFQLQRPPKCRSEDPVVAPAAPARAGDDEDDQDEDPDDDEDKADEDPDDDEDKADEDPDDDEDKAE